MLTTSLLQDFRPRLEDLLWSLWSELGVPGWERKHQGWWIDPEALLVFTATLEPIDQRLREEAIVWCLRHRRYLSTTRIRSLLRADRDPDPSQYQPQLGRFLATVAISQSLGFDASIEPYRVKLRQPSPPPRRLTRAALLSLRLRSLLGVTAKAEIIRVFLARSAMPLTATDLVNEGVGYTKRAVRDALEDLRMGGFVELEMHGNRRGYRFLARSSFANLLEAEPLRYPMWRQLFAVLRGTLDLSQRITRFRPETRPIEIRRTLTALQPEIYGAGLLPPVLDSGSDVADALEAWVDSLIESLGS